MKTTDEELRKIARERVEFKRHLRIYIVINVALWLFWYFSRAQHGNYDGIWPIWATIGWGIGIVSHYYKAYHTDSQAVEKEFEKLKRKQQF